MLTKAKAVVLAVAITLLTLVGLLSPTLAGAAPVAGGDQNIAAPHASPVYRCHQRLLTTYPVSVQVTPNARYARSVDRKWAIAGGGIVASRKCTDGYVAVVTGPSYTWHKMKSNKWFLATFVKGKARITGYAPEVALHSPSLAVPTAATSVSILAAGPHIIGYQCGGTLHTSYPVNLRALPTNTRTIGVVNRTWGIANSTAHKSCQLGWFVIVGGPYYSWHGLWGNQWIQATWVKGRSKVSGYAPKVVLELKDI